MNVVLTIDHPNRHFESFKLLRWHLKQNVVSGVNWHFWFSMKGNLISRPLPPNVDGGRDKKGKEPIAPCLGTCFVTFGGSLSTEHESIPENLNNT